MKQLISATLSEEAAIIYNNWEKQRKSAIISDMIVRQNVYFKMIEDMQKGLKERNELISRVIWELKDNPIHKSLCTDLNEKLVGTLHYQY